MFKLRENLREEITADFNKLWPEFLEENSRTFDAEPYGDIDVEVATGYSDEGVEAAKEDARHRMITNFEDYNNGKWIDETKMSDEQYEAATQMIVEFIRTLE